MVSGFILWLFITAIIAGVCIYFNKQETKEKQKLIKIITKAAGYGLIAIFVLAVIVYLF